MNLLLITTAIATIISSCGSQETSTVKDSSRWQRSQIYDMQPSDPRPGYAFMSQLQTPGFELGHYQGPRADGCVVFGPYFDISSSSGHGEVSVDIFARAWVYQDIQHCTGSRRHGDYECNWNEFLNNDSGNLTVDFYANGRQYAQKIIEWHGHLPRQKIQLDPFTWEGDLNDFEIRVCTKQDKAPITRSDYRSRYEGEVQVFQTHVNADWNP